MPVTSTIKSAGGDYTSLAAWEDAKDGLSADTYTAECYSGFDLGAVTIQGWTGGSVVKIVGATGHRNNGDKTAGAYITVSTNAGGVYVGDQTQVEVDGIRVDSTSYTTLQGALIGIYTGQAGITIKNCLLNISPSQDTTKLTYGIKWANGAQALDNSNGYLRVYNNIILNATIGIYWETAQYGTCTNDAIKILGNTIDGNNIAYTGGQYGIRLEKYQYADETVTIVVKNNVIIRTNTTDYYSSNAASLSLTASNNVSEDASGDDWGATGSLTSQTPSDLFTTLGSDYMPKVGSNLIDAGADLSAYFTTDIAGTTRSTFDIGAVEYAVVAAGGTFTIKSAGGDYTSLAAFQTAKHSSPAGVYIAECYSGFDLGPVSLSNWTAGSSVIIQAASGHYHNGVFTSGAYLIPDNNGYGISIGSDIPVTISGIRIDGNTCTSGGVAIDFNYLDNITIRDCLIHYNDSPTIIANYNPVGIRYTQRDASAEVSGIYIYNNIIRSTAIGIQLHPSSGTVTTANTLGYIYNNTIDGNNIGFHNNTGNGIVVAYAASGVETAHFALYNNVAIRNFVTDYVFGEITYTDVTIAGGYNASEDGTADDVVATGAKVNYNPESFFYSLGNKNYKPAIESALRDNGYAASGIFTTDIRQQARGASWDIGAMEYYVIDDSLRRKASYFLMS